MNNSDAVAIPRVSRNESDALSLLSEVNPSPTNMEQESLAGDNACEIFIKRMIQKVCRKIEQRIVAMKY